MPHLSPAACAQKITMDVRPLISLSQRSAQLSADPLAASSLALAQAPTLPPTDAEHSMQVLVPAVMIGGSPPHSSIQSQEGALVEKVCAGSSQCVEAPQAQSDSEGTFKSHSGAAAQMDELPDWIRLHQLPPQVHTDSVPASASHTGTAAPKAASDAALADTLSSPPPAAEQAGGDAEVASGLAVNTGRDPSSIVTARPEPASLGPASTDGEESDADAPSPGDIVSPRQWQSGLFTEWHRNARTCSAAPHGPALGVTTQAWMASPEPSSSDLELAQGPPQSRSTSRDLARVVSEGVRAIEADADPGQKEGVAARRSMRVPGGNPFEVSVI